MTSPDNPKSSGQQGDPEQASVIKSDLDSSGERTPSPAPRTEVEEPVTEQSAKGAGSGQPESTGGSSVGDSAAGSGESTARVPTTGAANNAADSISPPPWQRVPAEMATNGAREHHSSPAGATGQSTGYLPRPGGEAGLGEPPAHPPTLHSSGVGPAVGFGGATSPGTGAAAQGNRPLGSFAGTQQRPESGSKPASARRPGRGPRRASLQVKRVDPWSVLKLALVLSVALFFVWLVAVGVLYGVLSGMGVWDKLNGTYNELTQAGAASGDQLISAGRVFGIAAIIGAVNIVLFTALATLASFIYNVSSDLVGGIEVTLSERE